MIDTLPMQRGGASGWTVAMAPAQINEFRTQLAKTYDSDGKLAARLAELDEREKQIQAELEQQKTLARQSIPQAVPVGGGDGGAYMEQLRQAQFAWSVMDRYTAASAQRLEAVRFERAALQAIQQKRKEERAQAELEKHAKSLRKDLERALAGVQEHGRLKQELGVPTAGVIGYKTALILRQALDAIDQL